MDTLTQWIMQIIIFVLLAIIIELFIPRSKMAKYVRLIVGLIFILLLLKPVLYLFQVDMEEIVLEQLLDPLIEDETYQTWDHLTIQKEQLEGARDHHLLNEVTDRLKEEAQEVLQDQAVGISHIDYHFSGPSTNFNDLKQLVVFISPESNLDEEAFILIDEVKIDIDENLTQSEETHLLKIKEDLQAVWQIDPDELIVKWGN